MSPRATPKSAVLGSSFSRQTLWSLITSLLLVVELVVDMLLVAVVLVDTAPQLELLAVERLLNPE
jgi:hypothetical protein